MESLSRENGPLSLAGEAAPDRDEALLEVAKGIRDIVRLLIPPQALSLNATRILDQMGNPVLGFVCPNCGHTNRPGAKFSSKDGVRLDQALHPLYLLVCPD